MMAIGICLGAIASAQAHPPIEIAIAARSLKPGELVVFTLDVTGTPQSVTVDMFGRRTPAFQLGDGRWRALVGIDLDQKPGPYVATVEADSGTARTTVERTLRVLPKAFPTRTLRVAPDYVNPPPATLARIEADSAFLARVFANSAPERLWHTSFVRPVPDPANSRFGTRSVFNGEPRSPHSGADFRSPLGRPVKAPLAGHVVGARELFFTGTVVIIDHGLGMFSLLAHLSRIDVKEGDDVEAGEVVGLVGATGRVTGPHLHWSLRVDGARVDPVSALVILGRASTEAKG
jgi:murein DD-endopeptidase MepM/ murein hydrolase activator NlpD